MSFFARLLNTANVTLKAGTMNHITTDPFLSVHVLLIFVFFRSKGALGKRKEKNIHISIKDFFFFVFLARWFFKLSLRFLV